jgi:pimeloyl-ACP methyl ester carboxylesterase
VSRLESICLDRPPPFRLSLSAECALVQLGALTLTYLDPWMSHRHGQAIRDGIGRLYRGLLPAPGQPAIASALPYALAALVGGPRRTGHYFCLPPTVAAAGTPPDLPQSPRPHSARQRGVLIFLHGHGGNTACTPWALREWAEAEGLVVACPSFGYGNWEAAGALDEVERVRQDVLGRYAADPRRVWLAGLSQGGAGVSRVAAARPSDYRGLIFLSATMEPAILTDPAFVHGWAGRPIFVAQGGADHNVTPASVAAAVALLRRQGARVTELVDPEADHFLFFARTAWITAALSDWLRLC